MYEYNPEKPMEFIYRHEKFILPELTDSQKEFFKKRVSDIEQRLRDHQSFREPSRNDQALEIQIVQSQYTLLLLKKLRDEWEIDTEKIKSEYESEKDRLILDKEEDCDGWNLAIDEVRDIIEEAKQIK